ATLGGLAPGSTHSYSVKSVDSAGAESLPVSTEAPVQTLTQTFEDGYLIISYWTWADNGLLLANDTQTAHKNCWSYIQTNQPASVITNSGTKTDGKPYCKETLDAKKTSDATNASQYPGYKANVYDYQCGLTTTATVQSRVAAPGAIC